MASLPVSLDELSDLIGVVYDSAFEKPQWKGLLERLHTLFPEIGGCTFVTEGETLLPPHVTIGGPSAAFWTEATDCSLRTLKNEGAFESMRAATNGWIGRTHKFIDEAHYREQEMYRRYLKPAGYRHAQHLVLDQRDGRGAFIGLTFPDDQEGHDRLYLPVFELMKLLAPHCVRAFQLARMITLTRRSNEALGGFLDAIILPMVVVDGSGRYAFANAAGRRMIERGDRLAITGAGDVVLPTPDDTREARRRIAEVEDTLAPGGMRLWEDDTPLLLCMTPFRPTMEDASPLDRHLLEEERLVAIFLSQPPGDAIDTQLLRDVFDLTPREAKICQGLLSGQSAAEIADAAGRALKTVRNQIQTVHEKVGVTSNTQLIDTLAVFRTVGAMFDDDSRGLDGGQPMRLS